MQILTTTCELRSFRTGNIPGEQELQNAWAHTTIKIWIKVVSTNTLPSCLVQKEIKKAD